MVCESYLYNRTQRTKLNNTLSDLINVNIGVSQRSQGLESFSFYYINIAKSVEERINKINQY